MVASIGGVDIRPSESICEEKDNKLDLNMI
jgi:hypothetical protein